MNFNLNFDMLIYVRCSLRMRYANTTEINYARCSCDNLL